MDGVNRDFAQRMDKRAEVEDRASAKMRAALLGLDEDQFDYIVRTVSGGLQNIQDIHLLSPLQEGMLFHYLLNESGDSYILSTLFELSSAAVRDELVRAIEAVMARHDVLRTAVLWEQLPKPIQVVYRRASLPLENLVADSETDIEQQLSALMRPWKHRMDLRVAPLLRLQTVHDVRGGKHYAILHVHHIVCDHQSLRLIVSEVSAWLTGKWHTLAPPAAFRDYVMRSVEGRSEAGAETFFRNKLADIEETTAPFEILDVHADSARIVEASHTLDDTLQEQIRLQARHLGLTPARLFHAAWSLVVAQTSGRDDVVFGTVLSSLRGRSGQDRPLLGLFVNTLPLRLRLQGLCVQELVEHTDRELHDLRDYVSTPLTVAQRCAGVGTAVPLFTSLINYRYSGTDALELSDRSDVRVLARGEAWSNYPVTMTVDDVDHGFVLLAKAPREVGADRINHYLVTALQGLVGLLERDPSAPIQQLSILPSAELTQTTHTFNATHASYPDDKLVHEIFQEQAARTPETVAVVYERESLTFALLNRKANQLARFLRAKGVGAEDLVAICLDRSVDLLVCVLGVLKSGGGYLPLDPNHPAARRLQVLKQARPRILLTQASLAAERLDITSEVIVLNECWGQIDAFAATNLEAKLVGTSPSSIAYVIYTSGSTGQPKGVTIEHRSVLTLWQALEHIYRKLPACRRIGVNASFNFDASVKQYIQLLSGRTVVVIPDESRFDPGKLFALMSDLHVDAIDCTPWQLRSWLAAGLLDPASEQRLSAVFVGGEHIDPELWARLSRSQRIHFVNVYGPTESTVDTTAAHVNGDCGMPHIGPPLENRRVYILDRHARPVPLGVPGEIYIGGAGLARGYLGRAELTAERFLADPFSPELGARMYRTGDLGRWRADGAVEYLGRNDHQVKVRGYRVELGEIEAQLLRHDAVKAAVVIAHEYAADEKRLVAYVVPRQSDETDDTMLTEALRAHIKSEMPEYMIPSAFVPMQQIPLTPNGKLDRRALPIPDFATHAGQRETPRGEVEQILASIWEELLHVQGVGRQDNFFELGGHSLLIVQMLGRLRRIGLAADVRLVFESATLADLAGKLAPQGDDFRVPDNLIPPGCEAITPQMLSLIELDQVHIDTITRCIPGGAANIQDIYPLAPLQEGILFHHLLGGAADVYVVPTLLSLATRERLDAFMAALQEVINRHDVLRTAILWDELPRPVQVVQRQATLQVEEVRLDPEQPEQQLAQWLSPTNQRMELSKAPLLRLRIAADPRSTQWYLLIQLHHIIGDYTSQDVVTSEVLALTEGVAQLSEPVPYREHVAHALAYIRTGRADVFFKSKLGDVTETTAPFGLIDVHGAAASRAEFSEALVPGLSARAREQARRCGVSAATLFHSAWALVVAHTAGREDVVFGTVLLGRLQSSADAQSALGMFINTLPLRLQLKDLTARDLVERTQRELIELLSHEQASLAVAQSSSAMTGSAPLFTALLNFRHGSHKADRSWSAAEGIQVLERRGWTNYPIVLSVDDTGTDFNLSAQTDSRIHPKRIASYLSAAMESLVCALEQTPTVPALELSILPQAERHQLIHVFNDTRVDYPADETIHAVFQRCVERAPDAVAALSDVESLSYAALNAQANQLAHYLRSQGTVNGDFIPVVMCRSMPMLVAQIAVLKCGAVYVPVDPELAAERRDFILQDCGARCVLSDRQRPSDLQSVDVHWLDCTALATAIGACSWHNLDCGTQANAPAYVMYTSGSTGMPKGVVVPHRAVNRLAINCGYAQIAPEDCLAHYSNPSFDASTLEVWGALLNGARVLIVEQQVVLDAKAFGAMLRRHQVTMMYMSVGLFNQYANLLGTVFRRLRYLMIGGDSLEPRTIRQVLLDSPPQQLLNVYGPTECTTFASFHPIQSVAEDTRTIPIGTPISNTDVFILDRRREPVPIGVTGEIYLGGPGVACGYLNRPELTAQRFVPDHLSGREGAMLYKTGDLARRRADGVIEFLGRNDHQVKIRGFRVELGEIEARLCAHPQVHGAVVIARQAGTVEKRLISYVVPHDINAVPSAEDLRAYLKANLAEYMIPSAFVILPTFPLTATGKVDRKALPAPNLDSYAHKAYEAPQGTVEVTLAQIWQDVLEVERVGRRDNFFELGGHSLSVLKSIATIHSQLGFSLKVTDLYENPTVRDLARIVFGGSSNDRRIDLTAEAILDDTIAIDHRLPRAVHVNAVLLTGATGFVGRYLLAQLLRETNATIYCLTRAMSREHAQGRLKETLVQARLWQEEFRSRIVAIVGDLRTPRLGMDELTYEEMARRVDVIYHCATSMNHLETYAMAKAANVGSCREVARLAASYKLKTVNYISTLGVFRRTEHPRVVAEDTPIDAEIHTSSRGYAASKWVGEKIFMLVGQRGIPCNIFRLGLVWADTQHGGYDELQREYRLLASCLQAGVAIENYRFDMPPTPVDYVAKAIVALARRHPDGAGVFHLSAEQNPTEGLFERCNELLDSPLELLRDVDWVREIRRLHNQGVALSIVPLIDAVFPSEAEDKQRRVASTASLRFDASRTRAELETLGVFAPDFTDDVLRKCVANVLLDLERHRPMQINAVDYPREMATGR